MKEFKPGWYRVNRTLLGVEECCYFDTPTTYTAQCSIQLNGSQSHWWDAERSPPKREMNWQKDFKAVPALPSAEYWDHYSCTVGSPKTQSPIEITRLARTPTDREKALRSSTTDFTGSDGSCVQAIHIGVFFDGTNNNMFRDRPTNNHSNIVSLYDSHKDDKKPILPITFLEWEQPFRKSVSWRKPVPARALPQEVKHVSIGPCLMCTTRFASRFMVSI